MSLTTKSAFLTPAFLAGTLFSNPSVSYTLDGAVKTLSGSPASWPSAAHAFTGDTAKDTWKDGAGAEERTYTLSASPIPSLLPPSRGPLVALRDFTLELQVDYASPVVSMDWMGTPGVVSQETVSLGSCPHEGMPEERAVLVQRSFSVPSGVKVATSFYWPPPPEGPTAGYTAPLYQWVETKIEGLTESPIVLKGYYAQTYKPSHHNFSEDFLFEPRLEEGISPEAVAELEAKGIRMIFIRAATDGVEPPKIWTVDPKGGFHALN